MFNYFIHFLLYLIVLYMEHFQNKTRLIPEPDLKQSGTNERKTALCEYLSHKARHFSLYQTVSMVSAKCLYKSIIQRDMSGTNIILNLKDLDLYFLLLVY